MRLFVVLAATVVLAAGTAAFGLQEPKAGEAPCGAQTASVITGSNTASPSKPVQVGVLKDSIQPLIDAFNRDKDRRRLLALLSPT